MVEIMMNHLQSEAISIKCSEVVVTEPVQVSAEAVLKEEVVEDFGEDLEVEDLETTEEEDLAGAVADLEAAVSPLGMGFVEDVEDLETTEEEEDMETMEEEDMETTAAAEEGMVEEDTAGEDIRCYNLYIFV